jgi:hypothetical protein
VDNNNIRSTMKYLIVSTLGVLLMGSDVPELCTSHERNRRLTHLSFDVRQMSDVVVRVMGLATDGN